MSSSVPDPPPPSSLHPLLFTWEKERPFVRCHSSRFGPAEFNPGRGLGGRFHPFLDTYGKIVPVLYAADHLDGALSETVFHGVPVRSPGKRISRVALKSMVASRLTCERDLTLVQLFGFGLSRLGCSRLELIDSPRDEYFRTAAWARALHACSERIDGLIWVSRQNDGTRSVVLFGDRVPASSLRQEGSALPLEDGAGYAAVVDAAERAGILLYD